MIDAVLHEALSWPVADLPLQDFVDIYFELHGDSASLEAFRESLPAVLPAFGLAVRRATPGARRMEAEVVENAIFSIAQQPVKTMALALRVRVHYSDPLTPTEMARRQMLISRALVTL